VLTDAALYSPSSTSCRPALGTADTAATARAREENSIHSIEHCLCSSVVTVAMFDIAESGKDRREKERKAIGG
jgi:hypothetical protein